MCIYIYIYVCVYVYMSLRTIVLKEPRTALDLASLDFPSKIQEPLVPGKCCTYESKASSNYFGIRISIFLRTPYEPLLVKNPPTYPHPRQERHLQRVLHHGSQPLLLQLLVRTGARVCSIGGWFGVCQQKTLQLKIDGLAVLK